MILSRILKKEYDKSQGRGTTFRDLVHALVGIPSWKHETRIWPQRESWVFSLKLVVAKAEKTPMLRAGC